MGNDLLERTPTLLGSLQERVQALLDDSPEWLARLRRAGADTHAALGIPTTKHEEWKYTSVRGLVEAGPWSPAPQGSVTQAQLQPWTFPGLEQTLVVLVNGRYAPQLSRLGGEAAVDVQPLIDAVGDTPELATKVDAATDVANHTFAGLNSALFEGGTFLRIRKNQRAARPIHVLHVATEGGASFPRLLVVSEEGSDASLIESYASVGEAAGFTDAVTEVYVASNAHLEHIKVQRENAESFHIALTGVRQAPDSAYNGYSVTFGGALTRNDLNVYLAGSNIHSRMDGVYALNGDQVCDNHTRLDHAFPHCDSFEVYKGVLDGRSKGVFNGKIFVHQDAQKTDAKQTNQALLLSPHASIDTKPQLEIFADDVKCTHGATVGQLREDAMFYLRSRGIPFSEAEALLVYAFASEVLEKITVAEVRTELEQELFRKLAGAKDAAPAPTA
ncbi:MAG: Fe-S cluster assembly protein SufD [Fimbriimonadaceae bacterium]|nr:Fe-S cluster assembly protein SufD [Chthonomonadaceae bacterium]MCO5298082.1 Fe-S cluster assembly protein SufD [Fimbriimonadaceae bacterium]